jgi:23S rRNA (pseudouridine1915-N3)-methyltransferase
LKARAPESARQNTPETAFMRLVVVSIGRLKQGPEQELAERYRERFEDIGRKLGFRGLAIHEIPESRATFARQLGDWRDQGIANTIFAIGGADGLSPDLQRKAKLRIAFGSATWPHQMVRVMLLEQIYRAATILAGHPYHRA